ncbi:MAG: CopG family transcriptional regulator [Oceanipulchritudo sp.]
MRTTLRIEDGLLEVAKRRARERRSTLGEVVNEALKIGLLGTGEKRPDAERPLKTFRGDGVQPGVDLRHSAGLLEVMEDE